METDIEDFQRISRSILMEIIHKAIYEKKHDIDCVYDGRGIHKTLLMKSVELRYTEAVKILCSQKEIDIRINYMNQEGETALSYSLMPPYYNLEIVECLLQHGADPNLHPKNDTNLMRALDNIGSLDAFWLLIIYGANINEPYKPNPLGICIMDGRLDVAFELLHCNVDTNIPNQCGITPLGNAVCSKYTEMIYALIVYGANPIMLQGENENIITLAAQCGTYNVLKTVLLIIKEEYKDHLVTMLHHIDDAGKTPLIHAIETSKYRKASLLIQSGSNVDQCCSKGHIPLYYAISTGNRKMVHTILRARPRITQEHMQQIYRYYGSRDLEPIVTMCTAYFQQRNLVHTLQHLEYIRKILIEGGIPFDIAIHIGHQSMEGMYISNHIKNIDVQRANALYKKQIQ